MHRNMTARKKQKRHHGKAERSFIKEDNHRSVDVGHLRSGITPLHVRKQEFSEAYPEAAIREGASELTLRADEVGTLKAFINIDHIENDRWVPPLVDANWQEGEDWEELCCHYREMSKATGARKSQVKIKKEKPFGQRRQPRIEVRYTVNQLVKKHFWKNTDTPEVVGREHLKDPIIAFDEALKCLEKPYWEG